MARKMWGNDERGVYRAVVTVTYPAGWLIYGHSVGVGEYSDTTYHGPYLYPGPAKAAATIQKQKIKSNWRFQARKIPDIPIPTVDVAIEYAELHWKPVGK